MKLDNMYFKELTEIMKKRRTHYAFDFTSEEISKETIEQIITNGIWAPTHKLTQPWRFVVLEGEHHRNLGIFMADYYRKLYSEEEFSTDRFEETKHYPQNATLVALVFQPNPKKNLPEWEEIAAISCAVQNIWLSCTAMGLGGYWDTGSATIAYVENEIPMQPQESCLGIFYLGHLKENLPEVNRRRKPLGKKLSWHKN